ncbi:hypothetical protein LCGC14_2794370, partial [marine sediment metagenome]
DFFVLELKKNSAIEIIRPQQWYKNFLIFLPIIFSQQIFEIEILTKTVFGFIILCMAFGGSYIVNDLIDYKRDLTHPEKVKRPLTSGRITKKQANWKVDKRINQVGSSYGMKRTPDKIQCGLCWKQI